MTVGTMHREDTGVMAVIEVVDPLGIGQVEIDHDLPLLFADAIEQWLTEEHGYGYADVVARSAGARAESRKKLEMVGILDPEDFLPDVSAEIDPDFDIHVTIDVDTSQFEEEIERVKEEITELPEALVKSESDPMIVSQSETEVMPWVPPAEMIERNQPRGDGIPALAVLHSREPSVAPFDPTPAVDESLPGGVVQPGPRRIMRARRQNPLSRAWTAFLNGIERVMLAS